MLYKIEEMEPRCLLGFKSTSTFMTDSQITPMLFRKFMPLRHKVNQKVSNDVWSLKSTDVVIDFSNPNFTYEKWACVEVASKNPENEHLGMEYKEIKGGLYAIFIHKGTANDFSTFQYILSEWLPNSQYELDNRDHFEILPPNYDPHDENSVEYIYIPIRLKDTSI